ncbi:hypothetical protein CO608_07935 [Lysobacteraceae bacterium NML08-0793]|nr:hypothetical protein CO608_07935 [Xanthomonadaceae bacterium NML08-0793]
MSAAFAFDVLLNWAKDPSSHPQQALPAVLASGQLLRVLPHWQRTPDAIRLVYPRQSAVPKRLRVFMDFLSERWQNPPWDAYDEKWGSIHI